MANWKVLKKGELQQLAEELGVAIAADDKKKDIIKKIAEDPDFDESLTSEEAKIIVEEKKRIEREEKERLAKEKELERLAKEKELERLDKEKELERLDKEKELERVDREREKDRQYELERARIQQRSETSSIASGHNERPNVVSLKNVMQRYDPAKSEISLFLNLFQRQASKLQIEESQWTTQLLSLLPTEIAQVVLREDEENIDDFQHVKEMLLKRYKLSPEAFRSKFLQHQRNAGTLWKDLCFDLESYLDGWTNGLGIKDFESLKNLLVADQIKKRAPHELKDHFVDTWSEMTDPHKLAEKLDNYELVKRPAKKNLGYPYKSEQNFEKRNGSEKEDLKPNETRPDWRDKSDKDRTKEFEAKRPIVCYNCSRTGHFKVNCPQLKTEDRIGRVNFIRTENELDDSFAPYISTAKVNGREMTILRDSGANLDLISRDFVNKWDLTGEKIWIKQPLDNELRSLPLAEITIESDQIKVRTEAAVLDSSVELGHYILGNATHQLLEGRKKRSKLISAVTKHSQEKYGTICSEKKKKASLPIFGEEPEVGSLKGIDNRSEVTRANAESIFSSGEKTLKVELSTELDKRINGMMAAAAKETIGEKQVREERVKVVPNTFALKAVNKVALKGEQESDRESRSKKENRTNVSVSKKGELLPEMGYVKETGNVNEELTKLSEGEVTKGDNRINEAGKSHEAILRDGLQEIKNLSRPKTKAEIRKLLNVSESHARYVKDYENLVKPFTRALNDKNQRRRVKWNSDMNWAFIKLKEKLIENPFWDTIGSGRKLTIRD